jgi:hypothetical protein
MNDESKIAMLEMVVWSAYSIGRDSSSPPATRKLRPIEDSNIEGEVERLLIVLLHREPTPEEVAKVMKNVWPRG